MKYIKSSLFCMALLSIIPIAQATDVDLGGQHRVRAVFRNANQNQVQDLIQRFKLVGSVRPNEMFESHFWLLTNYRWGNNAPSDNISIYGYGDWRVSDEVMLRIGRTVYQIADGSTLGINDYENYPNVLDGAFITYNTDSVVVDLWGAYLPYAYASNNNNTPTPNTANANNAVANATGNRKAGVGVSLDVRSLPESFNTGNLFGIYTVPQNGQAQEIRLGGSIGGDLAGLDYKVNGAAHGVNFTNDAQFFVGGELGYSVQQTRVYGGYHHESANYNPFYYSRHGRSGLLDIVMWGNGTQYGEAGIAYAPMNDFEVGVLGYYFLAVGNYGLWSSSSANARNSNVIEVDVYTKKSYAGGFSIALHAGAFDVQNNMQWQGQVNCSFDF